MPSLYRFWGSITRAEFEQFKTKYPDIDFNLFCKQVIKAAIIGTINDSNVTLNFKQEKEQLIIKNLRREGAIKDLTLWEKMKNLKIETTLDQVIAIGEGKNEITLPQIVKQSTTKPLETESAKTPFDITNDRLVCLECKPSLFFTYDKLNKKDMLDALERLQQHIKRVHNRELSKLENESIDRFLEFVQTC